MSENKPGDSSFVSSTEIRGQIKLSMNECMYIGCSIHAILYSTVGLEAYAMPQESVLE